MDRLDEIAQDSIPDRDWPQPWGEDPVWGWAYPVKSPDLYNHPESAKARKAKDAQHMVSIWRDASSWERTAEDSPAALAVLECSMYMASKNKKEHVDALLQGFEEGLFPSHPVDAWKEKWMRESFVRFLAEANPETTEGKLAGLVLEQWPWAFGWAGQDNLGFRHPLASAVRKGNFEFAEKMMSAIKAEEWLDWTAYYDMSGIWKDRMHWSREDPSWVLKLSEYDPRLRLIDPKTGYGMLETASRDYLPDMVKALLDNGFSPDPMQSFGMTLSHWVLHKPVEMSWNRDRNEYVAKDPARIEQDAIRCGRTLGLLSNLGYGMDVPAAKAPKIPGIRRPKGLPKPPETASGYLDRLREGGKLKDETIATIQRSYLDCLAVSPNTPSPSTASRKRL